MHGAIGSATPKNLKIRKDWTFPRALTAAFWLCARAAYA
ncbi:hypothetical protein BN2497_3183 [Janthinobacterium sp. CG23_2]|nr:hypothetical protein BN2497_3183 [Janthinobacterium sp. CG23_2]CUU27989.1 hypothetical protein BN3177_3183 [Janthinobacterium sp. CG23_2]